MPRQARKQSVTDYYHVMIRGINREYIFKTETQKRKILTLIQNEQQNQNIQVFAWCIMDNHLHLLVKTPLAKLSKAIKIINLKYAAYYNNANRRVGSVFGDRYKSENIEDDQYLLGVLRYIHNNAVKANIVINANDYTWSSYRCYANEHIKSILVQDESSILELFHFNKEAFISFHQKQDLTEYLEIKEDRDKQKLEVAQQIIEKYFSQKEIKDIQQLNGYPQYQEELVIELREKTTLTLRQIAEIMGLSLNRIYKITKA